MFCRWEATCFYTSTSAYQLTYSCKSTYIERTESRVNVCPSKNLFQKLRLRGQYTYTTIMLYLLNSGRETYISKSFKITNKLTTFFLFIFTESIVTNRLKSDVLIEFWKFQWLHYTTLASYMTFYFVFTITDSFFKCFLYVIWTLLIFRLYYATIQHLSSFSVTYLHML